MKNQVVNVPTVKDPIKPSPGFESKGLSNFKLDIMSLCGFGCVYCYSNERNYLHISRRQFLVPTERKKESLQVSIAARDRGRGRLLFAAG